MSPTHCQGKGVGKVLTLFWENKMRQLGYELVMTSTLFNEEAQHFYKNLSNVKNKEFILGN